jgi:hypothetical protein
MLSVAVLALLGAGTAGLIRALGRSPDADLAKARADDADGSLLKTKGEPNSGLEKAPYTPREKAVMPDDVRAWLEHLERTEKKLVDMTTEQISQVMVLAFQLKSIGGTAESLLRQMAEGVDESDLKSPTAPAEDQTANIAADWANLRRFFESKAPPAECRPIYDDYSQALEETQYSMETILGALSGMASGENRPEDLIAKLQSLKAGNRQRLDAYRKKADDGVQTICDKYDTKKWFGITPDVGGEGGMLKSLGLGP